RLRVRAPREPVRDRGQARERGGGPRAAGAVGARAPREPGGPCQQLLRGSPRGRCAVPARLTSVLDALQALEAVLGVGESQICVPDGVLALLDSVQEALHG